MRRAVHIAVLAVLLAALCACSHRARVIPADKLARIYYDMFLVDQWIRDNSDVRPVADTTLVFDPIFRRYGYTFEDYDRSVQYYLDRPDDYTKLLSRVEEALRKEGERLQKEADAVTAREVELSRYRRGFRRTDFSSDSLRWDGAKILWPAREAEADTLVVLPDNSRPRRLPGRRLDNNNTELTIQK